MIKDVFFDCWFNFVHRNRDHIERDLFKLIKKDVNTYFGKRFEVIARNEFAADLLSLSRIGKWWYKDKEIDIVALDEDKKHIAFFECKWKDLSYNQSLKLLDELQGKAGFVEWFNGERTEQYGIIARNLEDKDSLRKKGFLVYDLDDWK